MTSPQRRMQNLQNRPSSTPPPELASVVAMPKPQPPPERIGDILKREREKRGDDLQQIADYLCIRRGFLEALENNRYEEFPADAYVIGFLRSYAEYLGLDGKKAIDRYRHEMAGRRKRPSLTVLTPISEGRAPSVFIMVGAAVAALLIYILWYGISTSDRTAVTVSPALPSAPVADTATPNVTPSLASTPASPAPPALSSFTPVPTVSPNAPSLPPTIPAETHLMIRADQSSWILISDTKGHTVYDHVMKPGDVFTVPNTPDLLLTTGNGGGIVLTLNGVDLPKLSASSSRVLRNIPLNANYLKTLPQPPQE